MTYRNHTTAKDSAASAAARDEKRSMATKTIDEGIKSLVEEMNAGKSAHYIEFMKFASQFHRYSSANMWLLMGQCQARNVHASHIASYKAWQDMGYQVKKGEKALYVWAPRPFTKEVENKTTKETELKQGTGFVLVPVFDASQIAQGIDPETGKEYPKMKDFFVPLPSNEQARQLYTLLVHVATDDGFTCKEEERSDGVQGWSREKIITVKSGRDDLSTLNTFVHEYAHGLLHWDGIERSNKQKECEAESVAYIVAQHYGLSNPFSSDYLLNWGNDDASLMKYMDRIRTTAHGIIEKLDKALATTQEPIAA